MASKRFGNFQPKQPSSAFKKARLDIDIIPSQQYMQQQQQRTVKTTTTIAQSSSSKSDYLWGDEDDEFIILASQAVEEVEMFQQTQMQPTQNGDSTFGGFLRDGVASSTQTITNGMGGPSSSDLMPPPPPIAGPSKVNPVPADVLDLLTDGDDDVFSEQFDENYDNIEKHIDEFFNNEFDDDFNLDEFRRNDERSGPKMSQERSPSKSGEATVETKAPITFKPKQPQSTVANAAIPINGGRLFPSQQPPPPVDREALKNAAKKKDHAKDIQVKFLTGQLEKANKERELLKKDYNEVTDRIQIRDGEVSMLRYELKNVKSQNDQLRLEKMKETETIKKEWVEKMKDLEKVIVAQKSELEFKNMEMISLKTKRMSSSFRTDKDESSKEKPATEKDFKIHNRLIQLFQSNCSLKDTEIDSKIFDLSAESISKFNITNRLSNFSKGDAVLSQHLGRLQSFLSQMICLKGSLSEESIQTIVLIANQATDEIRKYCSRLPMVLVKDAHLGAKVAYDFLCKNSERDRLQDPVNIYQREPIFHHEKAVIQRRFLAALGLLCQYLPSLAARLVRRLEETGNCVQILVKCLCKLSYASDLYGHFGMIASAASVLCGLSHHVLLFKEDGRQVIDLFKAIVYCRPDSALILSYLSETLFRISSSEQSIDLLSHLCWQSKSSDFAANDAYKMIQFTKDSCVLQIYATLLETSVPQDRILTPTEIRYLVANTRSTIYFLRNSLSRPVRWIQHFANRPDGSVLSLCQCHIRITNAFVVLLHQVLRCWMHCPLSVEYSAMLQITQNGVLLLFDLFETVYRGEILLVGRHVIQCRLQATYNWLAQHQSDFRFQHPQKVALQLLDLRLVMEEPLKSSEDVNRMDEDGDAVEKAARERSDMYDDLFVDFFTSKLQHQ